MKFNVWHSAERRTIDASTSGVLDSKHACVEGRHFKHIFEINLRR